MAKGEGVPQNTGNAADVVKLSTGQVRVRSNVTNDPYAWHLVPGELAALDNSGRKLTELQREEKNLYMPCGICNRTKVQIEEEGCDRCHATGQNVLTQDEARRRKLERTRKIEEATNQHDEVEPKDDVGEKPL